MIDACRIIEEIRLVAERHVFTDRRVRTAAILYADIGTRLRTDRYVIVGKHALASLIAQSNVLLSLRLLTGLDANGDMRTVCVEIAATAGTNARLPADHDGVFHVGVGCVADRNGIALRSRRARADGQGIAAGSSRSAADRYCVRSGCRGFLAYCQRAFALRFGRKTDSRGVPLFGESLFSQSDAGGAFYDCPFAKSRRVIHADSHRIGAYGDGIIYDSVVSIVVFDDSAFTNRDGGISSGFRIVADSDAVFAAAYRDGRRTVIGNVAALSTGFCALADNDASGCAFCRVRI